MRRLFFYLISLCFAPYIQYTSAEVPGFNQQVQAPVLEPSKRGSLVGELNSFAQDGNDLMKGGFQLSLPLKFPEERGKLLFPVSPTYGITRGMSEWGIGFETNLVITRYRRQGDLKYTDDEFVSPWGSLLKGTDGFFYPEGLQSPIRLSYTEDNCWIAYLEDGTILTFGGENATIKTKIGTYSWYLTSAQSVLNERSVYFYNNPESPGERPFLSKVTYGGKGNVNQYEITFSSEKLKTPLIDYRSGERVILSRRITQVNLRVLQMSHLVKRFSYLLTYKQPIDAPLFYLTEVKKKYASGAEEPPFILDYNYPEDFLKSAKWISTTSFNSILKKVPNALVPEQHSIFSTEDNGRSELEFANSYSRVTLKDQQFELVNLPTDSEKVDVYCRPPMNTYPPAPRLHSRMKGIGSSLDVVGFETRFKSVAPFEETTLHICNLEGQSVQKVKLTGFDLRPSEYTKLVDLTKKGKPDLVWIGEGNATSHDNKYRSEIRLKVFENISTHDTVAFRSHFEIKLDGILDRGKSYAMFQDINGDGILDFVLVQSSGIAVWYGKGNYEFEREPAWLSFRLGSWGATFDLYKSRINFHDLNGDGLPDAIVQTDTGASIFINQGDKFVIQNKGPLAGRTWAGHSGNPVVIDLLGTGNVQIAAQDLRLNHVNVIELSEPGTGLLKTIDDGKGNLVKLDYKRVPISPWIGYRFPVLNQMSLTISGEGTKTEKYSFTEPTHHSLDRGFLGFKKVEKESELGASQYNYQYGDQQPGILVSKQETDFKVPTLVKVLENGFTEVTDFGISWLRKSTVITGFKQQDHGTFFSTLANASTSAIEQTTLVFAEKMNCPSATQVQNARGTALYELQYFDSPHFHLSFSCLLERFSIVGTHDRSEMNFTEGLKIVRTEQGQPLSFIRQGPSPKTLQSIEYSPDFKIQAVTVPGLGKTEFHYNTLTTLLEEITTPTGITQLVTRDHLHDQIKNLTEERGNNTTYSQQFAFDLLERLNKSVQINSSESTMHREKNFRYAYATSYSPAWIEELESVIDESKTSTRKQLDLLSSSGVALGSLHQLGEDGTLIQLKSKNIAQGQTIDRSSKNLNYESFLNNLNYSSLYSDTLIVKNQSFGSFNFEQKETQLHQSGVIGIKNFNYQVELGQIVKKTTENNSIQWITHSNEKGKVTTQVFPNGAQYRFNYDVLGRISKIELPSGDTHQVIYNPLGEISRISRSGIGSINYSYQNSSSLLEQKDYLNEKNDIIRSILLKYDDQSRKKNLTYHDHKKHLNEKFLYYYDGTLPDGSILKGQNGRLTALLGPMFQKTWNYREDGKVLSEKIIIKNFGILITYFEYRSDGSIKKKKLDRQDSRGRSQLKLNFEYRLDSYGRESQVLLNDHFLYRIGYDDLSRMISAKGDKLDIEFDFDPETQKIRGFKKNMATSSPYFTSWELNQRGHIILEKFSTLRHEVNQSYQYSDTGYLSSYTGEKGETSYTYDDHQTIHQVNQSENSQKFQSGKNQWIMETGHYKLDSVGRVIKKDLKSQQLNMEYGPQGRVERAIRFPLTEVSYLYDDEGRRIIKKRGNKFNEVYIGNMILTPDLLLIPININGITFGYVENGSFKIISPDLRSTILSDDGITLNIPEPFGDRYRESTTTPREALLDYSLLGYDSDLNAYRAEYRDYDPIVKRFLTPDPLFFENPEKCVESPVECSLYGYAKNNPVNFVDPSGLNTHEANRGIGPFHDLVFNYNDSKISPTHTFVFTTKVENGVERVNNTYSWGNDAKSWTTPNRPADVAAATKSLDMGLSKMIGDSSLDRYVDQAYKDLESFDVHTWKLSDTCKDGADRLIHSAQETKFNDQVRIDNAISGRGSEQNSSSMSNFGITK